MINNKNEKSFFDIDNDQTLSLASDGDGCVVTRWRCGAVSAVDESGVAAAQRLPVPSRNPRGFTGPAAFPVLPTAAGQHTDCGQVGHQTSKNIRICINIYVRVSAVRRLTLHVC